MELIKHAKSELQIAKLFDKDSDYNGAIGEAVMELIEVFSKQGHSGMSAQYVIDIFSKVANFEPLLPLTGKDEEWNLLDYNDDLKYQNNRNSAVFKQSDGTVTYNNSIIKRCPDGTCWSGPLYLTREDAINNMNIIRAKVKKFPFTPKTFYIDVIEEEIAKDDWIMWIKDPSQLDEVKKYYELY